MSTRVSRIFKKGEFMRNKIFILLFILAVVSVLLSCQAFAETNFKYGAVERARNEYWKNWKDMDNGQQDTRNFFRFKTSLWGQMEHEKDMVLYVKLTNECRAHTYFEGTSASYPDKTASKKSYHFDINEVVFDNLYADIKGFLDMPLDLRLGRQDFLGTYGEGFLIMDGTPQDGSRTFYFNAAKASWHIDSERDLDFLYINNPRDEEFLPVINEYKLPSASNPSLDKIPTLLNTTDEEAGAIYFKDRSRKDKYLEAYYIYKTEAQEGGGTGYQSQAGEINALGVFTKCNMAPFTVRKQATVQFGKYGTNNRYGYGGYAFVDREFKDAQFSPRLSAGAAYLSGDKKSSSRNEGWDPMFSKWPWISELYVLSMAGETGVVGYWTNLQVYRMELALNTTKKTKLSLYYNYLRANAQVAANSIFSGTSRERGHLPQIKFDYKINDNITTYFLGEYLQPGDFYKDNDPGIFLRTELQIKF